MAAKKAKKTSKALEVDDMVSMPIESTSKKSQIKNPKILIPLVILAVVIVGFLLKGLFVAALVNGQPITRFSLIKELEKQGGKQTLAALINETLIQQEAKKKNVEVSQEEIDADAKQVEDSLTSEGQNLDTALSAQGLTREDFLNQIRIRILVEKMLANEIKVTDQEVNDFIKENQESLPTNLSEEEIKSGVRQQLEQQKLATKSQEWVDNLNKNATINYFVTY